MDRQRSTFTLAVLAVGHTDAPNIKYLITWADKKMGRRIP
jgi:hypothetical protein